MACEDATPLIRGSISRNPVLGSGYLCSVHIWQADGHTLAPSTSPLPRRERARRRRSAPRLLRRRILRTADLLSRSCTHCPDVHRSTIPRSVPTQTAPARTNRLAVV